MLATLVLAVLPASPWLGSTAPVHAQGTPGTVELEYAAPHSCPTRDTFEARLRARLGGAALSLRDPVRLAVQLRADAQRFYGSISLSDAHGVLGPRAIEAARCSEAVDALTFVAALLLDDRARASADGSAAVRAPSAAADPRGRRASQTGNAQRPGPQHDAPPAPAAREPNERADANPFPAPTERAEVVAAAATVPAPAATPASSEPAKKPTSEPTSEPKAPREGPAAERPRLRSSLAVSALAASGVAPSVRPGLGVWGALAVPLAVRVSFSLAIGLRTTLPQEVPSSEGSGRFAWWSGVLAFCAALGQPSSTVRGALCVEGEAGQIVAHGRDTDQPQPVRAPWLALGPTAHVSVHVRGPWRLAPGLGLLVPGTRDRFVIGQTELHQVPRLTFRAELALVVEWP